MEINRYLDKSPEVEAALKAGKPVVALESTIISHGMPYPQNVETALAVEQAIRDNGAVPATIAIIGGRLKAGLTKDEIEHLGKRLKATFYVGDMVVDNYFHGLFLINYVQSYDFYDRLIGRTEIFV